jgi:hypothetical protein
VTEVPARQRTDANNFAHGQLLLAYFPSMVKQYIE